MCEREKEIVKMKVYFEDEYGPLLLITSFEFEVEQH